MNVQYRIVNETIDALEAGLQKAAADGFRIYQGLPTEYDATPGKLPRVAFLMVNEPTVDSVERLRAQLGPALGPVFREKGKREDNPVMVALADWLAPRDGQVVRLVPDDGPVGT
jgi:hypothetical protein